MKHRFFLLSSSRDFPGKRTCIILTRLASSATINIGKISKKWDITGLPYYF
jgi:hypothetical protein